MGGGGLLKWLGFPDVYLSCSSVIFIVVMLDELQAFDEEMKLED